MYNHEIDTFIEVAQTSSFSQAAKNLYISKAAVAQQINNLENRLGLKLFSRTSHGVRLTEAGKVFLAEAHKIVQLCTSIEKKLAAFHLQIVVGSGYLNKQKLLKAISNTIFSSDTKLVFKEVLDYNHIPNNIDLLEMLYSKEPIEKQGFSFLKVTSVPYVLTIPAQDSLKSNEVITLKDLNHKTVAIPASNVTNDMQLFKNLIMQSKYDISLKTYMILDRAQINKCQFNNYYLLVPKSIADLCAPYIKKNIDWPMKASYGFYIRRENSSLYNKIKKYLKSKQ
ncbi:LysR family transcriptional regulator [Lactobacillus sp. ESL0677]|uniref:LysR family transcriptional regulator n=1 Tax=Lactobacillus sp. ESL0677 TaxID=2983208 RepID=UPI0023F78C14|nr:LysR family transcriptional regulator [Lactobacillus sp. ESL0677]WEV37647.1 LysR family transcriptional regulator [Lactobacillus sp. ESL0677]